MFLGLCAKRGPEYQPPKTEQSFIYPDNIDRNESGNYDYNFSDVSSTHSAFVESVNNGDAELFQMAVSEDAVYLKSEHRSCTDDFPCRHVVYTGNFDHIPSCMDCRRYRIEDVFEENPGADGFERRLESLHHSPGYQVHQGGRQEISRLLRTKEERLSLIDKRAIELGLTEEQVERERRQLLTYLAREPGNELFDCLKSSKGASEVNLLIIEMEDRRGHFEDAAIYIKKEGGWELWKIGTVGFWKR